MTVNEIGARIATRVRLLAVVALIACAVRAPRAQDPATFSLDTLKSAPSAFVFALAVFALAPGENAPDPPATVEVRREWVGPVCRASLHNAGDVPVRAGEVVLFALAGDAFPFPPATPIYAEGFTMLSQTGGTLAEPKDIGYLTDRDHYRLPTREGKRTVYNLLVLEPAPGRHLLLAFASCARFSGEFRFDAASLEIALDLEGIALEPGETLPLEEFVCFEGATRDETLARLAAAIEPHHPRLAAPKVPTGWCSWYCYGPTVTEPRILANLEAARAKDLPLEFIQIDDGYQAAMGDWLETGKSFGGGVQNVIRGIRERGFEPAIWVAPFIAEKDSRLFREHPDWFVKDDSGAPLPSDRVSFGGWRRGPWYALDGTHPEALEHLERVFRTIREEWGCLYFKLDANFWGALHGGRRHDPAATRVEAYRRGMEAVLRGAGAGSFLLGCNHPMWPSLGTIHGSRSSMDVTREWENFHRIADENFHRNWQNDRLWWNDPDCVLLSGRLTDDQYRYHAAAVLASGGMILSGDDLTKIPDARVGLLRKLLSEHPRAATFDAAREVARMAPADPAARHEYVAIFNKGDAPRAFEFHVAPGVVATEFWSGDPVALERLADDRARLEVPANSARVLRLEPGIR